MNRFGLSPENAQRFAGSLLHFTWQGALLAFLTASSLKFMSRRSAEMRYIVSIVSMVLMLALPIVTFAFYRQTGSLALRLFQLARTTRIYSISASPLAQETTAWTHWILAAWCAGVAILLARLVIGWYLSRRIVHLSDSKVPVHIRLLFEDIYKRLLLSRPIRLLVQVRIDTPSS